MSPSALTPLGDATPLSPSVTTLSSPDIIEMSLSELIPLPPSPVLLRLSIPAVMMNEPSHFTAAQLLLSSLLTRGLPDVITVVRPPRTITSYSELMPLAAATVTSTLSTPPIIFTPSLALMP